MAYKSILTALLESNSCMYILVADSANDLPNLPNLSQAGETADTRHFAKVGSCVRVVSDGHWYALSPSNEWMPLFYMTSEVDDAINENVQKMLQIMATIDEYSKVAHESAEKAYKCAESAEDSKNDASASAGKAAVSSQNAKAAESSVKNDLQSVAEAKIEICAIKSATEETLEQCKGYAGAASFAFGPDSDGNFSFFINEDDTE